MNDFDALYRALAQRMKEDLRQDPAVGLEREPLNRVIRALVRSEGEEKTWYAFTVDWERVGRDGPEAVAYDLIEELKVVRARHG